MENHDNELTERNRQMMEKYWASHDTAYLSDDVLFRIMATGQEHRGKEAVEAMFGYFYGGGAFEAHAELHSGVVDEDRAAAEADLIGRHVGEVAGVAATGKDVRVCPSPSTTTCATARSSRAASTSRCRRSSPRSAPYRADGQLSTR